MKTLEAPAKINLSHVVGPVRPDGKHEVATVLQRIDLADRISLEPAPETEIRGFPEDTLVRDALLALGAAARVEIEKHIPVAAGLGGGSSDAAAVLRLASEGLDPECLASIATELGADVPFFLTDGPQLGEGDGTRLEQVDLPQDYSILLVLPRGEAKRSTAEVYRAYSGEEGFERRRAELVEALEARDLAALPPNDLASSPLADELRALGAFRADVTGAGPAVYGLFRDPDAARAGREAIAGRGETWIAKPAW